MKSGLVERIKSIKERIFFFLESISHTLEVSLKNEETLLREINRRSDDICLNLAGLADSEKARLKTLEDLLADLRRYINATRPVNDPYASTDQETEYLLRNPEVALLQHLRSFIRQRNVLDIGANTGEVSRHLLDAGYRVFAFEPCPQTYERLCERFKGVDDFSAYPQAVAAQSGKMPLYLAGAGNDTAGVALDLDLSVYASLVRHAMPENLLFSSSIDVAVHSLKDLHQQGTIPPDVGIVKIDAEGADIQVIEGMGEKKYQVVITEFWDAQHFFSKGQFGLLPPIVAAMRKKGYHWHTVIYRVFDGTHSTEPRYYCNHNRSVVHSWGNVLFFRDYSLFLQAYQWCQANLPANELYR